MGLVVVVYLLSVFGVCVPSIHVPGENVDKNTLTTLGIKTIGWQNNESTNTNTSEIHIYHNYSKLSLQNENVESYNQYTQPQTNYMQKNLNFSVKKQEVNIKGPHKDSFSPQVSIGQELENEEASFAKSTDERKDIWEAENKSAQKPYYSHQHTKYKIVTQLENSNPYVESSSGKVLSNSNQYQQTSNSNFDTTNFVKDSNAHQRTLELGKIIQTEKQNKQSQKVFDYDQDGSATGYYISKQNSPQSKQAYDWQQSQHSISVKKNVENAQFVMVAYSKCPEGVTGQLIYKSSCHQFLNCWKGRGFVQNCAPGTLFNPQTLECDFASKVHCLTSPNVYRSEEYTSFNAVDIHKTGIQCPPEFSGVIPHKSDCSKFVNCANGVDNVMDCPPGTLFGLKINNCDFPYNAECAGWSLEFGNNNLDYETQGSSINKVYEGNSGYKTSNTWGNGQQTSSNGQHGYINSQTQRFTGEGKIINTLGNGQQTSRGSDFYQTGSGYVQSGNNAYTGGTISEHTDGFYNGKHLTNDWENQQTGNSHIYTNNQNYNRITSDKQLNGGYNNNAKTTNWENTQNSYDQKTGSEIGNNLLHTNNQNSNTDWSSQNVDYSKFKLTNQNGYHAGSENGYYTGSGSNWQTGSNQHDIVSNENVQKVTYGSENGYYTGSGSGSNWQTGSNQHGTVSNENVQKVTYGLQQGVDHTPRCPHGASGLFPHPTICAKFLNCANGQMFIQDCGPGTVFNPQAMVCDFPYNVECSDYRNVIDVRAQPKPSFGDSTHKNPQTGSTWNQGKYENHDEEGSSSNIDQQIVSIDNQQNVVHEEVECPIRPFGFYPHPTVCSKYFSCASGKATIYKCASGTVFNSMKKVCDVPQRVKCFEGITDLNVQGQHQNSNWGTNNKQDNFGQNKQGGSYQITESKNNQNQDHFGQNQHNQNAGTNNQNQDFLGQNKHNQNSGSNTQNQDYFGQNKENIYSQSKDTTKQNQDSFTQNKQEQEGSYHHNAGSNKVSYGEHNQQGSINQNTQSIFDHKQSGTQQNTLTGHTSVGKNNQAEEFSEGNGKFKVCSVQDFHCSSTLCIPKSMQCDGTKDCPNGIDERNCEQLLTGFHMKEKSVLAIREKERYSNLSLVECAKSCLDSKSFECKSFSYRTDAECFLSDTNIGGCGALIEAEPYNYYERSALTVDCSNLYKCPNNKCIEHNQICDGVNDCGDRIDERGCTPESFGYEIRLAGSSNKHEGRIELKAFGKKGYVCDDRFGMRDADVVCHELGYPLGALEIKGNSYFAKEVDVNDVLYLMDDVVCLGNETSIKDCDFNGWGVSNCEPQEIVGVVCKTPVDKCPKDQFKCDNAPECVPLAFVCDNVFDCPDQSDEANQHCEAPSEIRLVNGKSEREGRIEIRHHGIWGTVCDDDFNDDAAKVVCNSLGFPGKAVVKKDGFFGEGEGPIWLDQVFCQGNETLLQECTHWNWGEHNCEHSEDVGVVCSANSVSSQPIEIETEKKSNTDSPLNLIEVPAEDPFPTECGLRKNSKFYIDEVNFRVVQGTVAKKGFYPWQASLRIKNSVKPSHWCGAVVISRRFVLTAAHCLLGFSKGSYVVVAGDYNTDEEEGTEQEIYIEEFYVHEEFRNGQKMNNDIAVIKLKGSGFTFTKDIQPICLPESDLEYTNQLNCTISGFGSVQTGQSGHSHDLRAGWVPIQAPAVCKMPHVYGSLITDGMFCAGSLDEGVDACEGDSGGPLACLHSGVFTLYGLTSWGQHCGHANKPGVYVKVSYYRDWIDKTIKNNL